MEDDDIWHHPADKRPPHGETLLIFMHPHGRVIQGQWQHSGGALWAYRPEVPRRLLDRLDEELEAARMMGLLSTR